ncbi:PEP-CTERM sorting domain-containing protein [Phragmitibacter flavus]|uniref:PEP-CTERM sorting domain-containing protein n=1 Tax=Phragmitibacter flavus TaxID=2576071 RepID=A0A5R8KHX3_9BACT|nr:PEP-CTERM sorting domain-containing protein [Phragmitibacter flavus]TLD71923.1 PEP-CTERM sorting domain-containing protein [Phragmitibacter flavus]
MKLHVLLTLAILGISGLLDLHAAGAIVRIDTINPGDLTLILKDFNTTDQPHSSTTSNSPTPVPSWAPTTDGYHSYTVPTTTSDGKVYFNTAPYNVQYYTNVRVRVRSNASGSSDIWPRVEHGDTTVNLGSTTTAFTEHRQAWRNPQHPNINTATNGGVRWDPNTNTGTEATYDIDYIMVDLGRVVGFEFDVNETGLTTYQTWFNANTRSSNYRVEGSSLKGTTTHVDTYIQTAASLNLDTSIYKFVEIRLKTEPNTGLQFFWGTSITPSYNETNSIRVTATDDQWHIYLVDMSAETNWTGTLQNFRIDIGSAADIDYEIDYIRFREFGAVPEPTRALLLILAIGSIALTRHRQRPQ